MLRIAWLDSRVRLLTHTVLFVLTSALAVQNKKGAGTRTVTKEEPCDSFFNFFNPPAIPNPEEEELDEDEMEQRQFELESDYEMGIAFHGPCVRARVSECACVNVCAFGGRGECVNVRSPHKHTQSVLFRTPSSGSLARPTTTTTTTSSKKARRTRRRMMTRHAEHM